MSADCAGNDRSLIPLSLYHSLRTRHLCLGSLSCWKIISLGDLSYQSRLPKRSSSIIYSYRSVSILPSILTKFSTLSHIIQLHTIREPPPNFKVPSISLSLRVSPFIFQVVLSPSDPKRLILDSSE